jgi:oligopeptide/dipeptide ABC transporter ATP-binding protein
MQGSSQPLLRFEGVTIATRGSDSSRVLVSDVDLHVSAGEALGIVGESGSGKSLTALSVAGLLPSGVALSSGRISFEGKVLTELPDSALHRLRGKQISYVFQDPLTALNPTITIGRQITDVLSQHVGGSRKTLKRGAIEILSRLGIADAEKRVRSYPHQLSGGMRQRVLIALAMVCKPRILIADEPTTALDVTVQAKILELFRAIRTTGISLIFISHNIDVVLEFCDRVVVMYGGRVMEVGTAEEIGMAARHPYTQALLECVPRLGTNLERLRVIDGQPPGAQENLSGCPFSNRCPRALGRCHSEMPLSQQASPTSSFSCWNPAPTLAAASAS